MQKMFPEGYCPWCKKIKLKKNQIKKSRTDSFPTEGEGGLVRDLHGVRDAAADRAHPHVLRCFHGVELDFVASMCR